MLRLQAQGPQRKGTGQVGYFWFSAWRQQHFDDVHAHRNGLFHAVEPELGGAAQALAFVFIDAACRASCSGVQRAFYFCKNQDIAFTADDVYLAARADAELAAQNFVTLCPQPGGGH